MPVCVVCDGDDFEAREGLFFCTVCMTQSQDLREEEQEEKMINQGAKVFEIRTQVKGDTEAKAIEGRPWSSYEGFQIILKKQVEALIKMGADPKLKDIVFRLWCTYLSKSKVAFSEDLDIQDPLFKKFGRDREVFPSTTCSPEIKPVRILERLQENKRKAADKGAGVSSDSRPKKHKKSKKGDNDVPFSDLRSTSTEKIRQTAFYRNQVEFMDMLKTLAFCQLGLLYTNPLTTVSDIVRWVHRNEIPYSNASCLIPPHMKFGLSDYSTFLTFLPISEKSLRYECGRLIQYLHLTTIPKNPVTELVNKYLVLLSLPGDLHGLVHHVRRVNLLTKRYTVEKHKKVTLPPYDCIAMGYIIVTLEILLGLDGATERKLSKISEKMASLFPTVRLFIWDDWVRCINKKVKDTETSSVSKFSDVRSLDSVDQVTKAYKDHLRYESRFTDKKKLRRFNKDFRNTLLFPLKVLQSKSLDTDGNLQYADQGETTLYQEDIASTSLISEHHISEDESFDSALSHRTCRFKHITQPITFVELLNVEQNSTEDENEEHLPVIEDCNLKKYNSLAEDVARIHAGRGLDSLYDPDYVNKSTSYQWLLSKCATLSECSEAEICKEIKYIQSALKRHTDMDSIFEVLV